MQNDPFRHSRQANQQFQKQVQQQNQAEHQRIHKAAHDRMVESGRRHREAAYYQGHYSDTQQVGGCAKLFRAGFMVIWVVVALFICAAAAGMAYFIWQVAGLSF